VKRESTYQLKRRDLEGILFADNADVRSRFREEFGDLIERFLDTSTRAIGGVHRFGEGLAKELRAAWVEAFLHSAFNSSLTSCHLFISGFQIPAGNLMRHYSEAYAMALLCSHHAIDVFERFDRDPTRFRVDTALGLVQRKRNREILGVNAQGWKTFDEISKFYDQYSHAGGLSLATQRKLSPPGGFIHGGEFDEGKRVAYRKELPLRVGSMVRLLELATVVRENVKAAQAVRLFEPGTDEPR